MSEFTNEVVVNASTFEVEIDGLEGYREYKVAVAAATIIGVGPYSDVEVIKTGEARKDGNKYFSLINENCCQFFHSFICF